MRSKQREVNHVKRGIVILAHGSRAEAAEANQALLKMVELVKTKTSSESVRPAYMNRKSPGPDLAQSVAALVAQDYQEIVVAPWFLTTGIHILEDIPELLAELQARYPQVKIQLARPLGPDPRLADILFDRIQEVI